MKDPPSPEEPNEAPATDAGRTRAGKPAQRLLRAFGYVAFATAFAALLGVAAAILIYAYYARQLPSPEELHQRAASFKSTIIYDRHGAVLFEVIDPLGGRRTIVRRSDMPDALVKAVVATEDATFYANPGFSSRGIVRALVQNLRAGEVVQGASTITQQLVRMLYLTDERRLSRKIKEAILATEITRRYSKDEILEIYLNEVYFGNLAYGIEAASEVYFHKRVSALTLPEAALLAGLIQAPSYYDPYTNPDGALARRTDVLRLMVRHAGLSEAGLAEARRAPLGVLPTTLRMEAPHLVMYVRGLLEQEYGADVLYRSGYRVYTTLDLELQHAAEQVVRDQLPFLQQHLANNASVVAMDPYTGDVLALVGSVDFYHEGYGQVNLALTLQQPGSTIKPFTYLAAFERGWTPSTMVMDLAQEFPDGANPPYRPGNYDGKEYGPISVRTALACSRNIPAVSTLQTVGVPALVEACSRLGITTLTRPDYGLSLTLGGGDVTLMEMTAAFAALANGGYAVSPRLIDRVIGQGGQTIPPQRDPVLRQAMDPRHAYMLTDILSDTKARLPAFGAGNPLELGFPAAAKTGTTDDYRDSWTIGYTPQLVAGVWVGNNDNSPMDRLSGARGAALVWHDVMLRALEGAEHPAFARPAGLVEVEVCPISGQRHTERCPEARKDLFLAESPPQECSVHREVRVCTASGKLATEYCPDDGVEKRRVVDYGAQWDAWAQSKAMVTPPRETCDVHRAPTRVDIRAPGYALPGVIPIWGWAEVADFDSFWVEYGAGEQPEQWSRLTPEIGTPVSSGVLADWDTVGLPDGIYALRLTVRDRSGVLYEARATTRLGRDLPTATPTATLPPTPAPPSPTPEATPWPTPVLATPEPPTPVSTPEPVPTPEETLVVPTPPAEPTPAAAPLLSP